MGSRKKNNKIDRSLRGELMIRRLIAFVIDWYLASLIAGIPILLIYGMSTGKDDVAVSLTSLSFGYAMIAGTIAIALSTAYYVLIPTYVYKGQTLGKKAIGVKILCDDDSEITIKTVFKREIVGVLLVEGGIVAASGYLRQMIGLIFSPTIYTILAVISTVITVVSIIMLYASPKKKMIHELVSKTRIVKA